MLPKSFNLYSSICSYTRKRKTNWIGHILRRNCLVKQVIEGKIKGEMDVARRRGRGRKKLLDDLKDRRGYSHLKEEALDRKGQERIFSFEGGGSGSHYMEASFWRRLWTCRQTEYWMNEHVIKSMGTGGVDQLILNFGTRCRWVVRFTTRSLYSLGNISCYRWHRRLAGHCWREKSFVPARNWTKISRLYMQYVKSDLCFFILR